MSDDRDRVGVGGVLARMARRPDVALTPSELAVVARSELVPSVIREAANEAFLRADLAQEAARLDLTDATVRQRQADAATATRQVARLLRESFDAGDALTVDPARLDLVAEAINVDGDPRVKKLAIEAAVLERDLVEAKRMNLPLVEIERATERALRARGDVAEALARVREQRTWGDVQRAESPFWRSQRLDPPKTRCDHKFVDGQACVKCGWTPPLWTEPGQKLVWRNRLVTAPTDGRPWVESWSEPAPLCEVPTVPTDAFRRYFDDD